MIAILPESVLQRNIKKRYYASKSPIILFEFVNSTKENGIFKNSKNIWPNMLANPKKDCTFAPA